MEIARDYVVLTPLAIFKEQYDPQTRLPSQAETRLLLPHGTFYRLGDMKR